MTTRKEVEALVAAYRDLDRAERDQEASQRYLEAARADVAQWEGALRAGVDILAAARRAVRAAEERLGLKVKP